MEMKWRCEKNGWKCCCADWRYGFGPAESARLANGGDGGTWEVQHGKSLNYRLRTVLLEGRSHLYINCKLYSFHLCTQEVTRGLL